MSDLDPATGVARSGATRARTNPLFLVLLCVAAALAAISVIALLATGNGSALLPETNTYDPDPTGCDAAWEKSFYARNGLDHERSAWIAECREGTEELVDAVYGD